MSRMRQLSTAGLLLAGSLFLSSSAFAVDVSYFTTGSFSGGTTSGTSTYTSGGLTIKYTGVTAMAPNVQVPPTTNASFGSFLVTGQGNVNTTFTLKVSQTVPGAPATETFVSNVAMGAITTTNSQVVIRFLTAGSGSGGAAIRQIPIPNRSFRRRVSL